MSTQVACWNCGFGNPPGVKFCANCGKPQQQPCPECGAPVVEGAKFCANCGIPLGSHSPAASAEGPVLTAEARKVVTVLFADLAGSTGLTERLDPEEARQVIGKFYDVVQHVVERWFAGTVANYLGDGVLAVFGLPVAHEDDPERAVRAGLAIRDAMPVLNNYLTGTFGVQLAVRIGINTGEVVAASGSTFERDFLVSDAVTTAARLQQTVAPGTVVVGERTHRLTRDAIEYRELPPMAVKGKEAPLAVWSALAALPEPSEARTVAAPLVGRHGELGLLRSLYRRSYEESRVHLVTVLGGPGVGKSRLLRELVAELRDTDPKPLVLRGRSVAFGGQIGYHALLDILRFQAGLLDTDTPEVVRAKLAAWLNEMLPGQEGLLEGLLLTFGGEDATGADPGQLRQRLFESWRTLISGLAASRPVVLAFEDLHWADEGVLDLIQSLTEKVDAAALFIVCLARPELLERRPNWGGGRRNTTTLDLPPLRPQEVTQLVAALGSQGLAPEITAAIVQRAEGNPLFAEELVRMMLEGSTSGTAIPDTVQAVLTARVDRLPPNERRVLQAAAVIGRTFWPSAVGSIAGLPEDETAKSIEALITKELVTGRPISTIAGEREFAFRHILTRDVAYNILPKSQRQRAHAEIVRWFESRLGERLEEIVEILAEHLRVAGDSRAPIYLHRAGVKARRLYANADAIRLFDQALEAVGKTETASSLPASVYRDRGEVYQLLGEYSAAMADFDSGLAAARQAGDRALEAILENRIGLIHHRQFRLDEAESHFWQAIAVAREVGDGLTLGQSLVDLANIAWDRGMMGPDHPAIVEGLALLREAGDRSSLARGLNLLCMARLGAGNGPEAVAAAQEALTAAREAEDKSREATSLSYVCVVNGFLGRYRQALTYGRDGIRLAEEIGDRRRIAFTTFFIGRVQVSLGEWGDAIQQLEKGKDLAHGVARIQAPWLFFYLGMAYYEIGDIERARAAWSTGANLETQSPAWRQVALLSAVSHARLNGSVEEQNRALDEILSLPWGVFLPSDAETLLPVGEALLDRDRVDELRRFVDGRRPGLEKLGAPPHLAALAILDAQLDIRSGRSEQAEALLDRAVRWCEESEDAIRGWRALELRLQLRDRKEDRAALKVLLQRIADSLPEDLRATFAANPRTAVLRE